MDKNWTIDKLFQYIPAGKIEVLNKDKIEGIAYNSRKIKNNYLFVAMPGLKNNGADFIDEAIYRGAKAIVTEENLDNFLKYKGISYVIVDDAREALALLSAAFYDFPSRKLKVIGVTGTNGKTSTTYLLESILKNANLPVGLIGTINYRIGERVIPSSYTTPEALELQSLLREMVDGGITHVVMEVSSHALAQKRVSQIDFDIAVFTNLSQDHLDYHKNMEDYLCSKSLLFECLGKLSTEKNRKVAVVNGDDPSTSRILKILENFPGVEVLSFGFSDKNVFRAGIIEKALTHSRFIMQNSSINFEVKLLLPGQHNVFNALAAATCGISLGLSPEVIKKGLEEVKNVPGRFELIGGNSPFKIIVDYAHSEDALRNILEAARDLNPKKIILVFGCGGDRDKLKRPLMGKVAERLADFSILTSDNPRSEHPEDIIEDIESGFSRKDNYRVVLDRYQAIESALKMAEPDDMVIVAGKGHEAYQIYRDTVVPFDDREVIRQILKELSLVV